MPKTRAEFVNQCLTNLGVVATGQSISDDMVSKMDGIVDPAFATLNSLDIYYVQDAGNLGPSDGNIEDEAFLPLADYVANAACPAFNLPADAKMQALAELAKGALTTIAAPPRSLKRLRVDPAVVGYRGWYRGGFGW